MTGEACSPTRPSDGSAKLGVTRLDLSSGSKYPNVSSFRHRSKRDIRVSWIQILDRLSDRLGVDVDEKVKRKRLKNRMTKGVLLIMPILRLSLSRENVRD